MKALITDSVHPILLDDFLRAGITYTYFPDISFEEVLEIIQDYEILIINSKILVNNTLLEKAAKLKYIGRLGSGLEIIDFNITKEKGVKVFSSPEGNKDAVAEHAIGMLLALFNKLNTAHWEVSTHNWDRESVRGDELMGKTIGIIGYGNTGKAFARKLSGFGVNVLFYDKYLCEPNDADAKQVSLLELQEQADVISFHVPLTTETQNYFNKEFVVACKKPFYVINTSRGQVLNLEVLLEAINNKKVLGACLDVFENEKKNTFTEAYKQLIANLNKTYKVLFSPHVAGWTHQSKYKLAKILLGKILANRK